MKIICTLEEQDNIIKWFQSITNCFACPIKKKCIPKYSYCLGVLENEITWVIERKEELKCNR